jgi:hypothetical protein
MLSCFQNLPKNVTCAQFDFQRHGVWCSMFQHRGSQPNISFISRLSYDYKGNRWNEEDHDTSKGYFCFADMDTVLQSLCGELIVWRYDDEITPELRTLWDYMRDFWGRAVDACLEGRITCVSRKNAEEGEYCFMCGDRETMVFLDPGENHGVIVEGSRIRFKGRRMSERVIMCYYRQFAYLLGDEDHE